MLKRLFIAFLLAGAINAHAQDPHLSQYHSIASYLNPGFTGSNGCGKAAAAFRNQWPKIPGAFITAHASYEQYLHAIRGGLGLNYFHDRAGSGAMITDRLELTYAAHFEILDKKLILRPGVGIAWGRKKLDWENLSFGDMIDPRRGFVYTTIESTGDISKHFLDISSGVLFQTKYVHGGIAVHHINEPDQGFFGRSKLPRKYTAHLAGMIGDPDKGLCISPNVLFIGQQDFRQLLGGVTMKYDKFLLGAALRNDDVFIIQGGFQAPLFRVGYSYDHTISGLSYKTGGSHEITTAFNILCNKEKKITPIKTIAF